MARKPKHPVTDRNGIEGKQCSRCGTWKPLTDYYTVKSHGKQILAAKCKMCQSAISQDWAKRNPERFAANNKAYFSKEARKKSRRAYVLRTAYGMDEVDYDVLELVQDGTCLICRIKPDKPLVVDHNHDNGKVRGLLCGGCNIGIGALGDDPARLMRAAIYIAQQQNGVL